jgi:hypothetical protein
MAVHDRYATISWHSFTLRPTLNRMLALELPVGKSLLVAAVAVGALALAPHRPAHVHRLVLHAPVEPDYLYLTQWENGPIEMNLDPDHLKPIRFEMRAYVSDGCRWLGVETLTPSGPHRYAYAYNDYKLSCDPHALDTIPTPRTGWVDVQ